MTPSSRRRTTGGAFMGDECQAEGAVLTAPGDGGAVGFAILVRAQRGQVFLVLRAVGLRRRSSTCNAGLVIRRRTVLRLDDNIDVTVQLDVGVVGVAALCVDQDVAAGRTPRRL